MNVKKAVGRIVVIDAEILAMWRKIVLNLDQEAPLVLAPSLLAEEEEEDPTQDPDLPEMIVPEEAAEEIEIPETKVEAEALLPEEIDVEIEIPRERAETADLNPNPSLNLAPALAIQKNKKQARVLVKARNK